MTKTKKKSATKPNTVTKLQAEIKDLKERISEACRHLSLVAMFDACIKSDQQLIDQAVRDLQGKNYKKFVAGVEADYSHPANWWRTGDD